MVYEWKKPLYKINPQEVGQYLDSVAQRNGGIRPAVIVEEAREPEALLHSCFEWNDTEAAQKYREEQARAIVRNIVVVYPTDDKGETKTRAFVHVVTKPENGDKDPRYLDIKSALSDTQMRDELLQQAKRELISFKWSVDIPVRYNANAISIEQLTNLFNLGGFACGIGEWRPEKGGTHGMFHVA